MNAAEDFIDESLAGFVAVHAGLVAPGPVGRYVRRKLPATGKVAVISGGGSGHEPLHAGFVGVGMLDAACQGEVFTSPTPDQMLAAMDEVSGPEGTLFVVKNYSGDCMNFEMAAELTDRRIATVVVNDDVAVEESTWSNGRRGVAGTLIVEKMVGAAAEEGRPLDALKALGDRVNRCTRSMGVALSSCTVPATGKTTFTLGPDEMEIGVGIHGEPGRRRMKRADARAIVEEMLEPVVAELPVAGPAASPVILLVNGFGATPQAELYLMAKMALDRLAGQGLTVARSLVGSFVTSLDMAGCSLTVTAADDELLRLWDAKVRTPVLNWG